VTDEVRAAGGVVWRPGADGREVLVVHRPKYDDWTFPKGKADPGEDDLDCARREVTEETGFTCRTGAEVASTSYVDHQGRPKRVRYWSMVVVGGSFAPNREVDEVRWLAPPAAAALLSYDRDRALLASLGEVDSVG
jgi:8-oxo-dGTP diphosphatase